MSTSSLSEHLTKSMRPRYRVRSLLGSGGAAQVYLADDLRTGRRVAIKVLREELATTISAKRFLHEINIAAQLEHPSIVPVYTSGTADGLPYYVMPFLEGESLRTRLTRVGPLALAEVLHICEQVAAALEYAHRRRVIHRDIKPENVLLHEGRALVLDFGIALALDAIEHRHTLPGSVIGTPEYMSPEQAQGHEPIDGRSDVYSLACMAYEMISGHPPFSGAPKLVFTRHISAEPMPLCCSMPNVPHGLSAAVTRALAKTPDRRFATPGAFVAAMRAGCSAHESCRATPVGRTTEQRIAPMVERPSATKPSGHFALKMGLGAVVIALVVLSSSASEPSSPASFAVSGRAATITIASGCV